MKGFLSKHRLWLWFAAVALTYALPAFMSMHTGDDLGYMFADTVHHGGGGQRVTTFGQCLTTQCSHWCTTNGRFAVHVAVMAMLNLVPLWLYRTVNCIVFALLWLATVRLAAPRGQKPCGALCAAAWLLLLTCLPQPGLLGLTLAAYAINYVWVLCAAAWWLVALRQRAMHWPLWFYAATFALGTLHEGFSLPLCAAMLAAALRQRRLWPLLLALAGGTAVCVFAPGNMHHAAQGGGLAVAAIMHKLRALGFDLCVSPATYLFLAALTAAVIKKRAATLFCPAKDFPENRLDFLYTASVAAAVALAALTFTAPRQLTFAFWCAIMLFLGQCRGLLSRQNRTAAASCTAAAVSFVTLLCVLKYPVYDRYRQTLQSARTQTTVYPAHVTSLPAPSMPAWLCRAMAPDPALNLGLVSIGDRYTKEGWGRLYGHSIDAVLPAPPGVLASGRAPAVSVKAFAKGAAPRAIPGAFEKFALGDSVWFVTVPTHR